MGFRASSELLEVRGLGEGFFCRFQGSGSLTGGGVQLLCCSKRGSIRIKHYRVYMGSVGL